MRRLAVISFHTSPLAQPGTGDGGGMNVYVRRLSSHLAAAGLQCDVFTRTWQPGLEPVVEAEPGVRVHHICAGPADTVGRDRLPTLVEEFTEGVAERFAVIGAPDVIHANYWLSGLVGHRLKHMFGAPLVSTFHTLARAKAEADVDDGDLRARFEAEVVGCSDTILASSRDEADQLERLYGAVPNRIEVVPPGVDHQVFRPGDRAVARRRLGLGPGPVLLFVGRIQPLKGADVAIRALGGLSGRSSPPATLVIVGGPSGPQGETTLGDLHLLVADLGLVDRVRFVDAQAQEALVDYYRAADVGLVPSRSESFGLVALEAAACGLPVVASDVGGLRYLIVPGVTGHLVSGRDPASFAAVVDGLLADPVEAAAMGDRAAWAARRFQWSITAARLRRIYSDLTERQPVECV